MTDIVSVPPPPRRPNKSRLRTLPSVDHITTSSLASSINSASPVTSPIDEENLRHYSTSNNDSPRLVSSPTTSINSAVLLPPEKSKYRSRFTEHFDSEKKEATDISLVNNDYMLSPSSKKQKRPDHLKSSKSLNTITSASSLKKMSRMNRSSASTNSDTDELNLPLDHLMTTSTTTKRVQLTSSVSTPLQLPANNSSPLQRRKFGSNGSVLTSTTSTSSSKLPSTAAAPMSLNRADVIITRLEAWLVFLKSVTSWVEEVSKINLVSSRGYYQRAYPFLDESSAITTTTTTTAQSDASTTTLVQQSVNQTILTVQAGFQVLTMQIAAEQQDFAKALERDYLPDLVKLRKECKEKIHKLKNDPALALDELLRRAEVTRSKMTHLSRCCKQADKLQGQVEMDPWVANLLVLRQLKREVDEENRLRLSMIPIQKDAEAFETRLINTVKPTIQFCYETLAPGAWDGSADKDTAPFQLLMDQVMPSYEWSQFVELHKKDLVNEKNPTKDYLKINYPNKFHLLVMTLLKGKMERKFGVRKQFTERNYVLSQGGYLHQFSMDDKVSPEKTIYIPSCTIIPSIDISHLSNMDQKAILEDESLDKSNTFEICRPAFNVLQRDKVSIFRTSSREELITWCRLLVHIASGVSLSSFGITADDSIFLRNSSNSFDDLENHPATQIVRPESKQQQRSIATSTKTEKTATTASALKKECTPASSPARSIRSVRTEESFNEPAAMNKRRSANQQKNPPVPIVPPTFINEEESKTPITTLIPVEYLATEEEEEEEENNNADAESFVTARFEDETPDLYVEDEDHPIIIDDYFNIPSRQPKEEEEEDDDDAVSIASTSTAKGPTSSSIRQEDSSPARVHTPESVKRSPSLASTNFDDAQSSLYFSSTSAPPSPTLSSSSRRSSVVSIPDFQLVPETISLTRNGAADESSNNNNNNTRLSAAEHYKATLTMNLIDDD